MHRNKRWANPTFILGAFLVSYLKKDFSISRGNSYEIDAHRAIIIFMGHNTAAKPCIILTNSAGYDTLGNLPDGLSITYANSKIILTYTGQNFNTAEFKFLVY